MYLLDTNAWVVHLRTQGRSRLSQRLGRTPPVDLATCSIVRAELMTGAIKGPSPATEVADLRRLFSRMTSYPFDDPAADEYGRTRATLERRGLPIGGNDYMIAAIAVVHGLTLVTHNTGEFSRVPNLQLEDWQ